MQKKKALFTMLASGLGKRQIARYCRHLCRHLQAVGECNYSVYSFGLLTPGSACEKAGQWQHALALFHEMEGQISQNTENRADR